MRLYEATSVLGVWTDCSLHHKPKFYFTPTHLEAIFCSINQGPGCTWAQVHWRKSSGCKLAICFSCCGWLKQRDTNKCPFTWGHVNVFCFLGGFFFFLSSFYIKEGFYCFSFFYLLWLMIDIKTFLFKKRWYNWWGEQLIQNPFTQQITNTSYTMS